MSGGRNKRDCKAGQPARQDTCRGLQKVHLPPIQIGSGDPGMLMYIVLQGSDE